jgi:hypothetical protein
LAAFPDGQFFSWYVLNASNQQIFLINGVITQLSTNPIASLALRKAGTNTVQVAWPAGVAGATLQASTTLTTNGWENLTNGLVEIGMERILALPTTNLPNFFRLKFP